MQSSNKPPAKRAVNKTKNRTNAAANKLKQTRKAVVPNRPKKTNQKKTNQKSTNQKNINQKKAIQKKIGHKTNNQKKGSQPNIQNEEKLSKIVEVDDQQPLSEVESNFEPGRPTANNLKTHKAKSVKSRSKPEQPLETKQQHGPKKANAIKSKENSQNVDNHPEQLYNTIELPEWGPVPREQTQDKANTNKTKKQHKFKVKNSTLPNELNEAANETQLDNSHNATNATELKGLDNSTTFSHTNASAIDKQDNATQTILLLSKQDIATALNASGTNETNNCTATDSMKDNSTAVNQEQSSEANKADNSTAINSTNITNSHSILQLSKEDNFTSVNEEQPSEMDNNTAIESDNSTKTHSILQLSKLDNFTSANDGAASGTNGKDAEIDSNIEKNVTEVSKADNATTNDENPTEESKQVSDKATEMNMNKTDNMVDAIGTDNTTDTSKNTEIVAEVKNDTATEPDNPDKTTEVKQGNEDAEQNKDAANQGKEVFF